VEGTSVDKKIFDEFKKIQNYYNTDPLQARFSALITGDIGCGKTFVLKTCRLPLHIDSFDPGGTKTIKDWIEKNKEWVVIDTEFEKEDPKNPTAWKAWSEKFKRRLEIGYFKHFGTYAIDSATYWGNAAMNRVLKENKRAGEAPRRNHEYNPQKIMLQNAVTTIMTIPCDFILTGHLTPIEHNITSEIKKIDYRFNVTGNAKIFIPGMFDELYVIVEEKTPRGNEYKFLTKSQGKYTARSRLCQSRKLESLEKANIKEILKKVGYNYKDKEKLV
jgi:hypothetical protein